MKSNNVILDLIKQIAEAKEVSEDAVVLALEDAMKRAYEKEDIDSCAKVTIDKLTGKITLYKVFEVIDDNSIEIDKTNGFEEKIYNENNQILLSQAIKLDKNAIVGGTINKYIDINTLPRRVVSHILQVLKHDISIESNKLIYKQWIDKKGSIIYAEVEKVDHKSKVVTVNLGKIFGIVPKNELNPNEKLVPGCKYKFYIKDVLQQSKSWPIILSRANCAIVEDLLHVNIPEIQTGIVQIVKVGRIAGFKSKVVVKSMQTGVDPIGSCIGAKADRIKPILQEMGTEKIEFVAYDDDFSKYLVNVSNPAPLLGYKIIDPVYEETELGTKKEIERKKIYLIVPDDRLALIIGSKGSNVKILSDLLDCTVEAITLSDANDQKIQYTKVERIAPTVAIKQRIDKSNDKFSSIYNKHHNIDKHMFTIDAIENQKTNNSRNQLVKNEVNKDNNERIEQMSEEELQSYSDELAEIDKLTENLKK